MSVHLAEGESIAEAYQERAVGFCGHRLRLFAGAELLCVVFKVLL